MAPEAAIDQPFRRVEEIFTKIPDHAELTA
jgi:hypothetical protein